MYILATANGTQVSLQNVDSKLAIRPNLMPHTANDCAFSPDGSLLAVAHNNSPYITIYATSNWSKLANPSTLPSNTANDCAFSPDGSLLAVAHNVSPFITVYNTSTWTKLANPSTLPPSTANGCAFSPDGSLLAVAHANSPYITVYNTSTWTKLAIPSTLPPSTAYGCAFSPDGSLLAVAHAGSPYITVYNTSTWTAESGFSFISADARAVSFMATPAYRIRGTVRDKDGNLVSRTVRAHRRSDGVLVAQTVSDAVTGAYELRVYPDSPAEEYDVQFLAAPGELLNDLICARTTAEAVP